MANWSVVVGMGRGRPSSSRHSKSPARASTAEETELLSYPSPGSSTQSNHVWWKNKNRPYNAGSDYNMDDHDCKASGCQIVTINVSGMHYDVRIAVLNKHPETLLGDSEKRKCYYDEGRGEYFFDRHRPTFEAIFNYYQYGKLRKPPTVQDDIFLDELDFFEIEKDVINDFKKNEGYVEEENIYPENELQKKIWMLMEYPDTSPPAFVIGCISIVITLISIVLIIVESVPEYEHLSLCSVPKNESDPLSNEPQWLDVFFIIDSICSFWFTMEVIVRLVACPSKLDFFKDIKNYVDIAAIVPYYITLSSVLATMSCEIANGNSGLAFLRVLRLIRIFKLTKHFSGLQCLMLTFQASLRGLTLFLITLMICVLVFSSMIFYVESNENKSEENKIESIPDGFWWAVITMCTVGYGDVYPVSALGKVVGCLCAISGVLTLAIPVPIITENFNKFYIHRSRKG